MKPKSAILLIIAFAFAGLAATKAGEYHNGDKTALRNFLIQQSALEGKTNGELRGLIAAAYMILLDNAVAWLKDESWVSKVKGIAWNDKNPKRITEIDWYSKYGSYNYLSGILDVSGCMDLTRLNCSKNQLTSLNASDCRALTELICSENRLTNLNVGGCIALTKLDCWKNRLASLDVNDCIALTELHCSFNQLASLDVSRCVALTKLICAYSAKLASLNVSGCKALTRLHCYSSQLTSLDVSKNEALQELYCEYNRLKFSALPQSNYAHNFRYAPQKPMRGSIANVASGVDLSSEYNIGDNITDFAWFELIGKIEAPIAIDGSNGIFSLDGSYSGKTLVCKMTNATFPAFDTNQLRYEVKIAGDVSTNDDYEKKLIKYPVLTDDILTINNSDKHINNISLFDMSGKVLARYNSIDKSIYSIDISAYPNGTYLLDIDGESVRFVISR